MNRKAEILFHELAELSPAERLDYFERDRVAVDCANEIKFGNGSPSASFSKDRKPRSTYAATS